MNQNKLDEANALEQRIRQLKYHISEIKRLKGEEKPTEIFIRYWGGQSIQFTGESLKLLKMMLPKIDLLEKKLLQLENEFQKL